MSSSSKGGGTADELIKPSDYFIKYFTDEGEPYYCSINTDKTVWDIPDDGVLGMLYIHIFILYYVCTHISLVPYIFFMCIYSITAMYESLCGTCMG